MICHAAFTVNFIYYVTIILYSTFLYFHNLFLKLFHLCFLYCVFLIRLSHISHILSKYHNPSITWRTYIKWHVLTSIVGGYRAWNKSGNSNNLSLSLSYTHSFSLSLISPSVSLHRLLRYYLQVTHSELIHGFTACVVVRLKDSIHLQTSSGELWSPLLIIEPSG